MYAFGMNCPIMDEAAFEAAMINFSRQMEAVTVNVDRALISSGLCSVIGAAVERMSEDLNILLSSSSGAIKVSFIRNTESTYVVSIQSTKEPMGFMYSFLLALPF